MRVLNIAAARFALVALAVASLVFVVAATATSSRPGDDAAAAIAAGRLPADYRDWRLVSVAREEGDLDDIRAVLGNDAAIRAYRGAAPPFPDGAIIARIAWSYQASDVNNEAFGRRQSFVAGHPKNGVQFMVRDAKRFARTGGWLYAHFDDGLPVRDPAVLERCYQCHLAVAGRDHVFTGYTP